MAGLPAVADAPPPEPPLNAIHIPPRIVWSRPDAHILPAPVR
jgi:hypothetical protein